MNTQRMTKKLSVIVPVFNESEVLPEFIKRLLAAMQITSQSFEIIFVNDGSEDETTEILHTLCSTMKNCSALHLSRNFGHQQAVSAGLQYASGEYVSVIDGDLQDPPEVILKMYEVALTGYDVVYAVRRSRKEIMFKRASYSIFYRLLNSVASIGIPLDSGDFSVMSRRVVNEINLMGEYRRFIRGLRSYVGFKQTPYYYEREARAAGVPKYTFGKLVSLASSGILGFSNFPLRVASLFGSSVALLALVYAAILIFWRLFLGGEELTGFATLSVGLFFLGGVQLIFLGVLGEYLGCVYDEIKNRPSYIVSHIDGDASLIIIKAKEL